MMQTRRKFINILFRKTVRKTFPNEVDGKIKQKLILSNSFRSELSMENSLKVMIL